MVKNKLAPPFQEAEFDITYGEGISKTGEILDVGVECGIIDKSGSWYSYKGERIGQGRANVKSFFADNEDIYTEVLSSVRQKLGFEEGAKRAPRRPTAERCCRRMRSSRLRIRGAVSP